MKTTFRIKNHLLLAALAAAYPVLGHTAAAARVEFATGNVMAVSSAGPRPLSRGSELNTGETINTGEGRAQLRFADGALMSLQPQTEFRIDDYNFSGKNDGQEKGFFSLLRGGLRTISGYIGKGNRDAYKVTTSVATIGIRGTEWSGVLTPAPNPEETQLNLGTGEGAIEVCNAGGCIVVASGESAVVSGTTPPRRTDVRPNLPGSSSTNKPPEESVYSQAEDRTSTGELVIVDNNNQASLKLLESGSGYSGALSGRTADGYAYTFDVDLGNAVFDPSPGTKLVKLEGDGSWGAQTHTFVDGGELIGAVDSTGTIGWGTWTKGKTEVDSEGLSVYDLDRVHFAVGKGTPASDLSGSLYGMVGTYSWIGATTPDSTLGKGEFKSASLTAYFFGPSTTLDLDMVVKAGTRTYTTNLDGMSMSGDSTFSGGSSDATTWTDSSGSGTASGYTSVNGFFAGSKASHAGIAYAIEDAIGSTNHITNGAVAFKQSALIEPKFTSGSGFGAAMVGLEDVGEGFFFHGVSDSTSATFSDGKRLTQVDISPYTFSGPSSVTPGDALLLDGKNAVLGWGKWTGGTAVYGSTYALTDAHYVVGKLTSDAQIQTMSGTYTYSKVGGTTPTSQVGAATLNSASLQAQFYANASPAQVTLNIDVTAGGRNYTGSGSAGTYTSTFSGGGNVSRAGNGTNSLDFKGIFAGKNAKHAGVTYHITDGTDSLKTRGAIAFTR